MPAPKGIKQWLIVPALLLFMPLFAQQQQTDQLMNPELIFDWNETVEAGQASGNGLMVTRNSPLPPDYAPPLFSTFALEIGFRYPIFFDKARQVSFCAESPAQLGIFNSAGPSLAVPSYSTSIWLAVPAMISMNQGLGAVYDNADKNFGAYIGLGAAYNKALIREKNYQFYVGSMQQEVIPFRYVGYFTVNGKTGIRWRNRNGIVRNLGLEGNYGIFGEWMVGIAFGTVLGM